MNKSQPKFSIISAVYNNEKNIQRFLRSIYVQDYRDYELIIIDGGSADGTLRILEDHRDEVNVLISEPDTGIYNALNKGLKVASGEYIVVIHGDDILSFGSLSRVNKVIQLTRADVILGDSIYFSADGRFTSYKPARNYGLETIFRGIIAPHESCFIKKTVYNEAGNYDETYSSAADYKLLSKIAISGKWNIVTTGHAEIYKEEGGLSFSPEVDFSENYRLFSEYAPSVTSEEYQELIKLKNYRRTSTDDLAHISKVLQSTIAPSFVLRAAALALLAKLRGDNETTSLASTPNYFFDRDHKDKNRILFFIKNINGVSGGAERVLIDIASFLLSQGRDVLVASADGRVGTPFYRPSAPLPFVDIFSPPHAEMLYKRSNLRDEIESIIERLPDDILCVISEHKKHRDGFSDWKSFSSKCYSTWNGDRNTVHASLNSEIDAWINKYGSQVFRIRELIKRFDPGTVVPFMISASTVTYVAARVLNVKVIISNHNTPSFDYLYRDDWNEGYLDRALRLFAALSAHRSAWLHNSFLDEIPSQCRNRSVVLPNPIVSPKTVGWQSRPKVVISVGRLVALKGFDILIKSFAIISDDFPDWKLHIYGGGPEFDNLNQLICDLDMMHCIYLKGTTQDIQSAYKNSSLFVLCSRVEGFSLTTGEAMANGLPPIVHKECKGLAEMVQHDVSGFLVTSADWVVGFADAIRDLLSDQNQIEYLGRNAKEYITPYTVQHVGSKWIDVLVS